MQSVGISVLPKTQIALLIHEDTCLKVDESFIDGDTLRFYAVNKCHHVVSFAKYSYRLKGHNGTTVEAKQYYFNGDPSLEAGERREQSVHFGNDDRTESVEMWIHD